MQQFLNPLHRNAQSLEALAPFYKQLARDLLVLLEGLLVLLEKLLGLVKNLMILVHQLGDPPLPLLNPFQSCDHSPLYLAVAVPDVCEDEA